MSLFQPPDNGLSTQSPSSANGHSHFFPSKPALWVKTTSMESLPSTKNTRIHGSNPSAPLTLKKRHSTLVLSAPPDLPLTPNPPQRPLRNPARRGSGVPSIPAKPAPRKRPSTATGAREGSVPWTAVSSPVGNISTGNIVGGSVNSLISTGTRYLSATGPVEDVTPWELHPVRPTTSRHTLSTGPAEEVTPWELYPISVAPKRNRSLLATGLVEDVAPWELFPVPVPEVPVKTKENLSRPSSRPSTSSSQSLTPMQKLKQSSVKTSKPRSNTHTSGDTRSSEGWSASSPRDVGSPSSVSASPQLSYKAPSTSTSDAIRSPTTFQNPQFSTADRTILEELKRKINVRAAQFTFKGAGTVNGNGIAYLGKKHHPYGREEVPYPRSYDGEVLDLDVWETVFCQNLCDSLTRHVFETPPAKVLDLGCGTGTWVLNSARSWRASQFVGLDIVPLHPDLYQVGSPDLASRITWVQANFLEGLPFPSEEFDFVHIKRIALGVPEDKWDALLEEISRVMKPGAAFEMLEEDLFFPGKSLDDDSDSNSDDGSFSRLFPHDSSDFGKLHERDDTHVTVTRSFESHGSGDDQTTTATTSTLPMTPSRSGSPSIDIDINDASGMDEARELISQVYINYPELAQGKVESTKAAFPPRPADRPPLELKSPSGGNLSYKSKPASSAVSLLTTSTASVPPLDDSIGNVNFRTTVARRRGYSLTAATPAPAVIAPRSQNRSQVVINEMPSTPPPPKSTSFLVRTVPATPINPRDHSLLEWIYTQMLESRFINTSPLALLANSLGLYFKDVRTHPPLQYAFPPKPTRPPSHIDVEYASDVDSASDSDNARHAILPSSKPRSTKKRSSHAFSTGSFSSEESEPIYADNRFRNIKQLLRRHSQYIKLDDARSPAFAPSVRPSSSGVTSSQASKTGGSRLPNTTINFDLKSLNLHLALRVAEIIACSEAMWEWVLEHQAKAAASKASKPAIRRVKSGFVEQPSSGSLWGSRNSPDYFRASVAELTRDEFNALLSNFELDMRGQCSLSSALEDRFSWSIIASAPSAERKIFEMACEKWDKWEREQLSLASSHPALPNRHRPARPGTADTLRSTPHFPHEVKNVNREGDTMKIKRTLSDSSGTTLLPPTRRLSRATRVFVAWKA